MYLENHKGEEVGYWRKANHIHKWFVDNIQKGNDNCRRYLVPKSKLKGLLLLCEMVCKDPKLAKKYLPNRDGFFFGGVAYDEYYFSATEETRDIIKKALKSKDLIYYQSSW